MNVTKPVVPSGAEIYAGRRIMVVLHDLRGGGAERISVILTNGMAAAGAEMTLVLLQAESVLDRPSGSVKTIDLHVGRTLTALPKLVRLFRQQRPDVIFAHMTHVNVAVLAAALLSGYAGRTILVEHNQFDLNLAMVRQRSVKFAYQVARVLYKWAGAIIAVSGGVADTLSRCTMLRREEIHVAYNPVVLPEIFEKARVPVSHPFLDGKTLVILAIGKLLPQKDFPTLLEAIAIARRTRPLRAIILGEGGERNALLARRAALGLDDAVDMPGFVTNPYSYLAHADLFVLSSRWEGLPTVVIEALALGVNVVATDCPSGPREILGEDKFGRLVPVGDAGALAEAMLAALAAPADPAVARARGGEFTLAPSLRAYGKVIAEVLA